MQLHHCLLRSLDAYSYTIEMFQLSSKLPTHHSSSCCTVAQLGPHRAMVYSSTSAPLLFQVYKLLMILTQIMVAELWNYSAGGFQRRYPVPEQLTYLCCKVSHTIFLATGKTELVGNTSITMNTEYFRKMYYMRIAGQRKNKAARKAQPITLFHYVFMFTALIKDLNAKSTTSLQIISNTRFKTGHSCTFIRDGRSS